MHGYSFTLNQTPLTALASGLLWWQERRLLCVSDLHLGKSDRMARRGGALLPPYENRETLDRLSQAVSALDPLSVICLGDSFDDTAGQDALDEPEHAQLTTLMAGRRWIWIEGNHDPGPVSLGGTHMAEYKTGPLVFRHIADPDATSEISGHYHPKASLRLKAGGLSRPCFLIDDTRVILPAFGVYAGGMRSSDPVFAPLMSDKAVAVLTGSQALPIPMPRS
nr:ligase-associated DNA damage response endonuclease PdeM [Amylibacter sp.]